MNSRTAARFAQYGFVAIGIGAFAYCADVWLRARLYQQSQARYFNQEVVIPHRIPRVATRPVKGGLVGRLEIPRLGISVIVVEGAGHDELERGAGHIPGAALPGQPGIGIAAHRDTWFRPLETIHSGDTITLQTLETIRLPGEFHPSRPSARCRGVVPDPARHLDRSTRFRKYGHVFGRAAP